MVRINKGTLRSKDKSINVPDQDEINKWLKAAADIVTVTQADIVPKGWYTIAQLAKSMNVSNSAAYIKVNRLTAEGKTESKRFRILRDKRVFSTMHYRLLD